MSGGPGPGSCCLPSSTDTAISGWPLISRLEFDPQAGAVPCARLHTRLVLREWQQISLVDAAELVACELVTNAITATRAIGSVCPVWLRLASDGSRTLVLVGDASPDPPQRIDPAGDTEGGRGLLLVEALSNSWGWYATREHVTTKTVWAELRESGAGINSTRIGGVHMAGRKP
jgi:anti-sigma regulatory factor (Ser/Thr protein kinase)